MSYLARSLRSVTRLSLAFLALLGLLTSSLGVSPAAAAPPAFLVDLATVPLDSPDVFRAYGARGNGGAGLPVAAGPDVDGDGAPDVAVAFFTAAPMGRTFGGEVALVFGNGRLAGVDSVDTGPLTAGVLRIVGATAMETAGNEIWIDDITGDGLGDLLICRQNFTPDPARPGAGALTVIAGGPELAVLARRGQVVDLADPPPELTITHLVGAEATDRLGIWVRTGDVDGDGIVDVAVGADQEDGPDAEDRGAVWVVRGGAHWASGATVDLAGFGATAWEGLLAKIEPPAGTEDFHLGATCQVADLDGNGRAEVLAAAALNRSGAAISPAGAPGTAEARGGAPRGEAYIVWDENFFVGQPGADPRDPWPPGFTLDLANLPGDLTRIRGEAANVTFGEELVGGLDYDADGEADLFVGDLASNQGQGLGHLFFSAVDLRGRALDLSGPVGGLRLTRVLGPRLGSLGADTAAHGDFDGDGIADIAFTSPHAFPQGRPNGGVLHVVFGQPGPWPVLIRTAEGQLPDPAVLRITEVQGARGRVGADEGDTLGYSATAFDVDGDGRTDLVTNEMVGNGLSPDSVDAGNLIVLHGEGLWPGLPALIPRRLSR